MIRDDRRQGRTLPAIPTDHSIEYDAVLYDCPECKRSHFVTVLGCPDAAQASQETAETDRQLVGV